MKTGDAYDGRHRQKGADGEQGGAEHVGGGHGDLGLAGEDVPGGGEEQVQAERAVDREADAADDEDDGHEPVGVAHRQHRGHAPDLPQHPHHPRRPVRLPAHVVHALPLLLLLPLPLRRRWVWPPRHRVPVRLALGHVLGPVERDERLPPCRRHGAPPQSGVAARRGQARPPKDRVAICVGGVHRGAGGIIN